MKDKDMMMSMMGHEMKVNPPAILEKTRRKKGKKAAERQRRAILLNKVKD